MFISYLLLHHLFCSLYLQFVDTLGANFTSFTTCKLDLFFFVVYPSTGEKNPKHSCTVNTHYSQFLCESNCQKSVSYLAWPHVWDLESFYTISQQKISPSSGERKQRGTRCLQQHSAQSLLAQVMLPCNLTQAVGDWITFRRPDRFSRSVIKFF